MATSTADRLKATPAVQGYRRALASIALVERPRPLGLDPREEPIIDDFEASRVLEVVLAHALCARNHAKHSERSLELARSTPSR